MIVESETRNSLKTLKFRNRKLVLAYLRKTGAISVNEISRFTGLSKMTVHKIIDHYLDQGMVVLAGKGESTEEGGKKPNLFAFNPNCRFIYAVRLGDGFYASAMANLRGDLIGDRIITTINGASFDDVMTAIRRDFDTAIAANNLDPTNCMAVVISCNGIVDVENGVCLAYYQNQSWGSHLPIRDKLAELFPTGTHIHVDSWWRHMALAEILGGDASRRKRFFLMGNSGDYVSGGMVSDGKVLTGATGFAGEIGHMVINPDSGEQCVCGGVGCLQTLVVPSKVVARALQCRNEYPDSALFRNGNAGNLTFAAIATASNQGDPLACQLMTQAAGFFALAINNIVQICDPGLVVMYGDYAKAGDFFLGRLRRKVNGMTMHGIDKKTEIVTSLGDDLGVIGAANMMADALFSAIN